MHCDRLPSCGCPFLGIVQGQIGCVFGQPGLVKDLPAYGRGFELDDLWVSLFGSTKSFNNSVIL